MDRKLKYEMWEKQERHVTIELMANQIFPYFEKTKLSLCPRFIFGDYAIRLSYA